MVLVPSIKLQKFLVTGLSAAVLNLLLLAFFVEVLYFRTYFLKNLANILSIFICIIYNFIVSRLWTWGNIPKKSGKELMTQFLLFNIANLFTMLVRGVLFAWLEKMGMYYLLNATLGIAVAAAISYLLYDRLVFTNR